MTVEVVTLFSESDQVCLEPSEIPAFVVTILLVRAPGVTVSPRRQAKLASRLTYQVLELMVGQLNQNLAQKSITMTVTDEAKKWVLSQTLSDRSYGARPLRRALQKYIEDPLSEALIQGTITTRPAFIEVFLEDNKLYYRSVDSQETEGVLL